MVGKVIDLTAYFDTVEVDLKADLSDWHKVRMELWEIHEKKRHRKSRHEQ
jgi:hypothetical protein